VSYDVQNQERRENIAVAVPNNRTRIMEQALSGDMHAFGSLADEHYRIVYGIAFSIVGDWNAAEDIAQETFLLAWARRTSLRNAIAFPTWLRRIAENLSKNWIRSKDYRRRLADHYRILTSPETPEKSSADRRLDAREQVTSIWSALESLPPGHRQAIVLYYLHEESLRDVAAALGISENAAKKRLHRGRNQLREHFEERWLAEMSNARSAMRTGSARDRFLAAIAVGPAVPELGKSAASTGLGLWWETSKQTVSNKILLGAAAMSAKKVLVIGVLAVLMVAAFMIATTAPKRPNENPSVPLVESTDSIPRPDDENIAAARRSPEGGVTAPVRSDAALDVSVAKEAQGAKQTSSKPSGAKTAMQRIVPKEIPDPKDYAWVEGIVVDEKSAPVSGANVTVAALGLTDPPKDPSEEVLSTRRSAYNTFLANRDQYWNGTTDDSGSFRIDGIKYEGLAIVTANVPGHTTAMKTVNLVPASAPEFIRLQIQSGVTITGRVLSAEAKPVTDASVRLMGFAMESGLHGGSTGLAVFTDAEGRFELGVEAPGVMSVTVSSPTFGLASFTNIVADPEQEVLLQYGAGTAVFGRVSDERSQPVHGAEVRLSGTIRMELVRPDGSSGGSSASLGNTLTAQTAQDGSYRIEQVDPGQEYRTAVFAADGVQLAEGKPLSDLEPGAQYELDFVVRPQMQIKGRVLGKTTDRPLAGMSIMAIMEDPDVKPGEMQVTPVVGLTKSGVDGSYEITLTGAGGRCAVVPTFSAHGFSGSWQDQPGAQTTEIKPGDSLTLDLIVPEPATRSFLVVTSDGGPVEGASVSVQHRSANGSAGFGLTDVTDAQGHVTLRSLRPEIETEVSFSKSGFISGSSESIICGSGDALPEETVVMYGEADVSGTLAEADEKPVAGRRVRVTATYGGGQRTQTEVTTGEAGEFAIASEFPAAEVSLAFSAEFERDGSPVALKGGIETIRLGVDVPNDLGTVVLSPASP
jgi:RNA polymerase sigma factor (sigma-70 family)